MADRIVFVSNCGETLPLVYRLKKMGISCPIYLHNPGCKHLYDGLLNTKVDLKGLTKALLSADRVVFDTIKRNEKEKHDGALLKTFGLKANVKEIFGAVADKLKTGHKVFCGSEATGEIELDRFKGEELARKAGLIVPETHRFKNLNEGIKFLRGKKDHWVFKPHGNLDLDLTYVEKYPGELVGKMEYEYRNRIGDDVDYILQKAIEGIEISCFDEKTEILTQNGWKFFKDLSKNEAVCTLNPKTDEIEFHVPEKIIAQSYKGQMYQYAGGSRSWLDFCVTPNHRVPIKGYYAVNISKKPWRFIEAQQLIKHDEFLTPRCGKWKGKRRKFFCLPKTTRMQGFRGKEIVPAKKILIKDWCCFLGWYLSEGSATKKQNLISISQKNRISELEIILNKYWHWDRNGLNYRIYDKQLFEYLKKLGKSNEKYIPNEIKCLSSDCLEIFLEAYNRGDGWIRKNTRFYSTTSLKMADDLQEIILKCGRWGNISVSDKRGKFIFNKSTGETRNHNYVNYIITESFGSGYVKLKKTKWKIKQYNGKIFCVSVPPNRIVYVRRNGKPIFSGNTEGWFDGKEWHCFNHTVEDKRLMNGNLGPAIGSQNNTVWLKKNPNGFLIPEFKKMTPFLKEAGYIGPIDINAIVSKDKKPYFLEFCYSEDTEVLTHSGWRAMKDVKAGEIVAGLDDDKNLIYVPVESTTRLRWDQPIVHIKSDQAYDLMVTPNHNMCLLDKNDNLITKPAIKMSRRGEKTIRTANWTGLDIPTYTIPAHTIQHIGHGKVLKESILKPIVVDMKAWVKFLALYLSNGNLHTGKGAPYSVQISETKQKKEVSEILAQLGFAYKEEANRFVINSIQLGKHIESIIGKGKRAWTKRLPRFILDLSKPYLEDFLDAYTIGDGSIHKRTHQRLWTTTSKGLADDLCEILLRVGRWAIIKNIGVGGYEGSIHDHYRVSERNVKINGRIFPKRHCSHVPYDGYVVCLTVPYHRLYVRRPNGPSMWCCQTPRMGYDAFYCLMELMKDPLFKFWVNEFDAEFWPGYAGSARVSIPPFPYAGAELLEDFAKDTIIRGRLEDYPKFWAEDVYINNGGKLACAGSDGILGVVASRGNSIGGSVGNVYRELDKLKAGNYLQYRTDLGRRAEKAIKTLKSWGLDIE